ncbi:MAG: alpha/beta fold hydrolase [Gammaproteobacteria bacterium]|nr:alpha/beta fold hydrolase [Gammaproteobacteria bacterium]
MTASGATADNSGPACVVLLHGLARTAASMEEMEEALAEAGFRVANIDYPSRDHPIEELADLAIEDGLFLCGEPGSGGKVHFVTHSLGGILVRYYFENNDSSVVGRVVMLGPPNQGSVAADKMADWPGFDWLNGPAGLQLGKGPESIPLRLGTPGFEFAVIAGNRTIDPITSAVLDDPDDGKVSVDDTRLDGMADFRVMPVSHAYIMKDDDVIDLVIRFLQTGAFDW